MVTFFNLNFLLFFILFFPLSYFFYPNTRFFLLLLLLFFFPLCFYPPRTHSSCLIHPQPHLLTFNHFFFLLFYLFVTFSPHLLLHFSIVLSLFLCPRHKLQFRSAQLKQRHQVHHHASINLWFMVLFYFILFLVQRKKLQKKKFWPQVLFAFFFFFFPGSGGFDECGCGWVCD